MADLSDFKELYKLFKIIASILFFSLPLIYQNKQLNKIKESKKKTPNGNIFSQVFLLYCLMTVLVEIYLIYFNPPPDDCVDCGIVLYIMPPFIIGLGLIAALIGNALVFGAKLK